jgi:hypothetical protein
MCSHFVSLLSRWSPFMQSTFELRGATTAPTSSGEGLEDLSGSRQAEMKSKFVGQMKIPVYQKPHFWSPDFVKCEGKIIKYDLRALGIWRVSLYGCSAQAPDSANVGFTTHTGAGELLAHDHHRLGNMAAHRVPLSLRVPYRHYRDLNGR